ncbi:DUF1194 domain-containing protein [Mesorhizobium sp. A623]
MLRWLAPVLVFGVLFPAGHSFSQPREPVDVELVLAVDISVSMTVEELEIQRDGYAAALTDPEVVRAITSGMHGKVAITYFEWAGVTYQKVIVPWTLVAGQADAEHVAKTISELPAWQPRRTSISGALHFGADLLAQSPFKGIKRIIDVSSDGANNEGPAMAPTRDAVVRQGITINGLPILSGAAPQIYDVPELDRYFAECVMGGPGAFVISVNGWKQFPEAIRRKLLLELVHDRLPDPGGVPKIILAKATQPYDCMIGEKRWKQDLRHHMYNPENEPDRRKTP